MKKLFYLLISIWFCLGSIILSQNPEWITYNTSNSGLPDNRIGCIAIDESANKWIGAARDWIFLVEGGLVKFDGTNWTVYNTSNSGLPFDYVNSLTIDGSGNKWIGTLGGGLAKFDGLNWTVYDTSNSGLPGNYATSIAIDGSGNKWIGAANRNGWSLAGSGLVKFNDTNWTAYNSSNSSLPDNDINCLAIDGGDVKWIGTREGLAKFDGTNWVVYDATNSGLPYNNVISIAIDGSGNKWIGTSHGGLAKFDDTNWTVYNTSNSGLPGNRIRHIAIDESGNKWIGTDEGLAKFDGTNWIVYNASNSGLPDNIILCIAIDESENKWIGTFYGGLLVFKEGGIVVPVELNSFTATANGKEVALNWSTATELNNQGFEVQRKFGSNDFVTIGFVKGHGTTTYTNNYTYVDKLISAGKYFYRLKQIDYNGSYEYSNVIEVEVRVLDKFTLEQNYPNPFNPSTTIKYQIQKQVRDDNLNVQLIIYDILGSEVASLVNQKQKPGNYEVTWDASGFSSGVYFYQLKAGEFMETKKLMLLK